MDDCFINIHMHNKMWLQSKFIIYFKLLPSDKVIVLKPFSIMQHFI